MAPADGTQPLSTDELFRQHAGFVARFLARLGVPAVALEDTLQEVFLAVHRGGGYRPGLAKPRSYLANLAIYAAANQRRKRGHERLQRSDAPLDGLSSDSRLRSTACRRTCEPRCGWSTSRKRAAYRWPPASVARSAPSTGDCIRRANACVPR